MTEILWSNSKATSHEGQDLEEVVFCYEGTDLSPSGNPTIIFHAVPSQKLLLLKHNDSTAITS